MVFILLQESLPSPPNSNSHESQLYSHLLRQRHPEAIWKRILTVTLTLKLKLSVRILKVIFLSVRQCFGSAFIIYKSELSRVNIIDFFSQASERDGILNPQVWLANHVLVTGPAFTIRPMGWIFPRCSVTAPKFRSKNLVAIVNLFSSLHLHRRLVNASLSLFTVKWQRK